MHTHDKGSQNITGNVYLLDSFDNVYRPIVQDSFGAFTQTSMDKKAQRRLNGEGFSSFTEEMLNVMFNANNSGAWTGVTGK